jgi:ADP-ribose pyrophosphatase YjhB (NUDIX family)
MTKARSSWARVWAATAPVSSSNPSTVPTPTHHQTGTWAVPGGHLEFGESHFTCAEREVMEETGLQVKAKNVVAVTSDVFKGEGPGDKTKHYVTLFVECERVDASQEAVVSNPSSFSHAPNYLGTRPLTPSTRLWSRPSARAGNGSAGVRSWIGLPITRIPPTQTGDYSCP